MGARMISAGIKEVKNNLSRLLAKVKTGEDVLITGFGKFCVKNKRERMGRNPQTAEQMKLRARQVVTFRCSSVLRDKINRMG